jgi:hypothetical protein
LDQGIHSLAACPRTCCAVFLRIYRDYTTFREPVNGCVPVLLSAFSSTKFERSAQNAHGVLVGILPRRGTFPSPCNGLLVWKVLPSLPIFPNAQGPGGRLPNFEACVCSGSRYGLNSPVEQLPLRSSTAGWVCLLPDREALP